MQESTIGTRRELWKLGLIPGYALLLLLLAPLRPLWLDEWLPVLGEAGKSLRETCDFVAHNPGAAPLGYLPQSYLINTFGHSLWVLRIPSIAASAIALAGMWLIARRLSLWRAGASVALLAVLPMFVRYSIEARPYGFALACSIASSAALIGLQRRRSWPAVTIYAALSALGIYVQPFAAFVTAAQVAWLCLPGTGLRKSRGAIIAAAAAAVCSFLPWFLYVHSVWTGAIAGNGLAFDWSWKSPWLLIREFCGGGIILSAGLFWLAGIGYRCSPLSVSLKRYLLLWLMLPIVLALAADAVFGYFVAARQVIFGLPPLCILAVEGIRVAGRRHTHAAAAVACGLLAISIACDCKLFLGDHEDWGAAARAARETLPPGTCLLVAPRTHTALYLTADPQMASSLCDESSTRAPGLVLVSPYAKQGERITARQFLAQNGYAVENGVNIGHSELLRLSERMARGIGR